MLTAEELSFLKSQNIPVEQVYDARGQTQAEWKAAVRAVGKTLVLGSPCRGAGHRLKTRSGHCVQCDTSKISYQQRFNSKGYVYVAGSKSLRLLKIGTAIDIEQRELNLNAQAYAGGRDWKIVYFIEVDNGGKVEVAAQQSLQHRKITRTYLKDGLEQLASELFSASLAECIAALDSAAKNFNPKRVSKYRDSNEYNF